MQYFNTDYKFLMYGFGAKLPPYFNSVSHCFACSGNYFNHYINWDIQKLISTYKTILEAIKLHGPTIFS